MSSARRLNSEPIAIVRGLAPVKVIEEIRSHGRSHVVQKDGLEFDSELLAAQTMVNTPTDFFSNPLDVIMGAGRQRHDQWQGDDFVLSTEVGEKKSDVLARLQDYLTSMAGCRLVRDDVMMAADELYTNGAKSGLRPSLNPAVKEIIKNGTIEIFVRVAESRLVLACRDSYGELDIERVMARLHICFDKGVAQSIHQGVGGAGIGSFMVFNACASYYAGVEKGRRTVVAVTFALSSSRQELKDWPKNIHLLVK